MAVVVEVMVTVVVARIQSRSASLRLLRPPPTHPPIPL